MRCSAVFLLSLLLVLPSAASAGSDAACSVNGICLHGRVKVVKNFADLKVQVVHLFPDLRVKKVKNFPDSCGEWQFVDNFPDFTIQFVKNFPDLTIQYVGNFPGMN